VRPDALSALFGCHHVDVARHDRDLLAPTFRAFRLRHLMFGDSFGTLESSLAFLATICVGWHDTSPHAGSWRYLGFSPSICSIRSLPAFSNSASVWPRSPLIVSVLGLGSSSAHRPAKRQQIDRSRFIRSILQLLVDDGNNRRSWFELSISQARSWRLQFLMDETSNRGLRYCPTKRGDALCST